MIFITSFFPEGANRASTFSALRALSRVIKNQERRDKKK